jgi:hypothetical protein
MGGIISAAIIITAAAAFHGTGFKPANAGEMPVQLDYCWVHGLNGSLQ